MKRIFYLLVFVSICSVTNAQNVFYNTVTGDVACFGTIDPVKYIQTYPELSWVCVSDDNPLLKEKLNSLKVVAGVVKKKSSAEIQVIIDENRKKEIRALIRNLKTQYVSAMQESAEGFNVSSETTTIRQEINTLKQEYQGLP